MFYFNDLLSYYLLPLYKIKVPWLWTMLLSQVDDIVYLARILVCHAQLPVLIPQHCINHAP